MLVSQEKRSARGAIGRDVAHGPVRRPSGLLALRGTGARAPDGLSAQAAELAPNASSDAEDQINHIGFVLQKYARSHAAKRLTYSTTGSRDHHAHGSHPRHRLISCPDPFLTALDPPRPA